MTILPEAPAGANTNDIDQRVFVRSDDDTPEFHRRLTWHTLAVALERKLLAASPGNRKARQVARSVCLLVQRLLEVPRYGVIAKGRYATWNAWAADAIRPLEQGWCRRSSKRPEKSTHRHAARTAARDKARAKKPRGTKQADRHRGRRMIDAGVLLGVLSRGPDGGQLLVERSVVLGAEVTPNERGQRDASAALVSTAWLWGARSERDDAPDPNATAPDPNATTRPIRTRRRPIRTQSSSQAPDSLVLQTKRSGETDSLRSSVRAIHERESDVSTSAAATVTAGTTAQAAPRLDTPRVRSEVNLRADDLLRAREEFRREREAEAPREPPAAAIEHAEPVWPAGINDDAWWSSPEVSPPSSHRTRLSIDGPDDAAQDRAHGDATAAM